MRTIGEFWRLFRRVSSKKFSRFRTPKPVKSWLYGCLFGIKVIGTVDAELSIKLLNDAFAFPTGLMFYGRYLQRVCQTLFNSNLTGGSSLPIVSKLMPSKNSCFISSWRSKAPSRLSGFKTNNYLIRFLALSGILSDIKNSPF